jgi:hypothetical protein
VANEVLGPFVDSDVDVRLPKQLFRGERSLLEDGPDEGRVVRPVVEVLDHGSLYDVGDATPNALEVPLERAECLVALALVTFQNCILVS